MISNAKRMGYSMEELNYIHLIDFLRITRIHFGFSSKTKITKTKVKSANQSDIDSLLS